MEIMEIKFELKKQTLYPKTKRIGIKEKVVITEKLDGSNLGIFKLPQDALLIAQRNNTFIWNKNISINEIEAQPLYKGLLNWLNLYGEQLINNMHDNSGFFGEWIAMGRINYYDRLGTKYNIFAKANITEEFKVTNLYYDHELFIYPFKDQVIPDFIGVVPTVAELDRIPSIEELDKLYFKYVLSVNAQDITSTHEETELEDGTKAVLIDINKLRYRVEGFVIDNNNVINKYVRVKGGQLTDHKIPK